MEQSTNAKLVNWIREKVKTEYANDFIICGIGYDIFPISWGFC